MDYKEQIFKWMAENEDEFGNIRTADLFVFINSLPSKKEIAKGQVEKYLASRLGKFWKQARYHLGEYIKWLDKEAE